MADLVQVVDEYMQFKNQENLHDKEKKDNKPEPITNIVTFVDRKKGMVHATCKNCNTEIEYVLACFDNKDILHCPQCNIEFYANPFSKNIN